MASPIRAPVFGSNTPTWYPRLVNPSISPCSESHVQRRAPSGLLHRWPPVHLIRTCVSRKSGGRRGIGDIGGQLRRDWRSLHLKSYCGRHVASGGAPPPWCAKWVTGGLRVVIRRF